MSTAGKQVPKLCGKGAGAEAGAVAGITLAVRRRSVLLSQGLWNALCSRPLWSAIRGRARDRFVGRLRYSSSPFFVFYLKEECMMKKTVFTGAATAIVTPFKGNEVDYDAFGKLIDWQIEEGIDGIVVTGTTGEACTLTDGEHKEVIRYCVERVRGRVPVIAGTGSNDTAYAVNLTRFACEAGADAMLLVTPYYNKATQKGLVTSFSVIADASDKPCILYNVPTRTGCNILPETAAALAEHPNIVGIKEASGNISQIARLAALCGDKMDIYSGNDDEIVPILSLGGKGVISVMSNILPKETSRLCKCYFEGDTREATRLQLKYVPLVGALFCEVNPIPVKAALAAMGRCENALRLPLTPMEAKNVPPMLELMRAAGLAV